ncbi:MAG TPA: hypothetical protein VJ867_05105 [Gemmatimonadaceae bacterium]|nr:hypothetical protein [Gemmatimonadaceae bacterium]
MADVQVNNTPSGEPVATGGGGSGAVWAIVVIVLLAIIAWFVFGRGMVSGNKSKDININAKVETPAAPAPSKTP